MVNRQIQWKWLKTFMGLEQHIWVQLWGDFAALSPSMKGQTEFIPILNDISILVEFWGPYGNANKRLWVWRVRWKHAQKNQKTFKGHGFNFSNEVKVLSTQLPWPCHTTKKSSVQFRTVWSGRKAGWWRREETRRIPAPRPQLDNQHWEVASFG